MKEVKKRRRKNALIVLLAMLIAVVFSGYGVVNENAILESVAELTLEPGSKDDEVYTYIKFKDWECINGYVMEGGISTGKAEDILNQGYCLEYMQAWKDAGKIPADFVPASQKAQTSSSNTSNTSNADTSATNTTTTPATSEKKTESSPKQEIKKYTDEEIANAWKVTTTVDATCATDGYKEYKNSLTNEKKTETIPATGKHDYQVTDSTDSTCTEKGSATYTCTVCGDTYTEETDFADHDYKEVETKDATCMENGYVKYECSVCGDTYEETIKATGHDDGKWVVTKEASLFNSGERTLKCTVCGEILDTEEIAPTCPIPLAGIIVIAVIGCVAVVVVVVVIRKNKNKEN